MVDIRKIKLSKCNSTWDEKYFSERLAIPNNVQNYFNMMSAKVSRKFPNQNDNVHRVEIRGMDDYIQSMNDTQIDSDVTFLKILLESLEPHDFM